MYALKLLLLVVAAATDCEETELLQAHASIPGLDKFMKSVSEVMDKGNIGAQGIGKVTGTFEDGITKVGDELQAMSRKFNESVKTFQKSLKAGDSVAQNLTKFEALVDQAVKPLVPGYKKVFQQVEGAMNASKSVLALLGQTGLTDQLETCSSTVVEKLGAVADSTDQVARGLSGATEETLGESLEKMDSLLSSTVAESQDLRSNFNQKLGDFTGSLEVPLSLALGEEAPKQLEALRHKADHVLGQLESFVSLVNSEMQKCGGQVDTELQMARNVESKPLVQKIFGIFGR